MQSEKIAGPSPCLNLARTHRTCFAALLALLFVFLLSLGTPMLRAETTKQKKKKAEQQARLLESRRMRSRQRRIQQTIQNTYSHRYEIYGGGMYMRFRPGPYLHNAGTGGWALGLAGFLTPRFGITGDARGYYGSSAITVNNPYDIHNASFSSFTFTAGPQYRFYRGLHFALSAALQGGINYGYFDADTNGFPPEDVGLYPAGVVPAGIASIHADYNLSPGLALRLSPHMLINHFGGSFEHNQGFMVGLVYRFKRQ